MKIVISLFILLVWSGLALAVEWNPFDNLHVNNIRAQGQRDVISFITTEATHNPAACGGIDHYAIDATEEVSKEMLSILLSAAATGNSIGINIDSTLCLHGRPKILDVWINY